MSALSDVCTDIGIENMEYPVVITWTLWRNWAIQQAEDLHRQTPDTHYSIAKYDTHKSWPNSMEIYKYIVFKHDESTPHIYNTKDGLL